MKQFFRSRPFKRALKLTGLCFLAFVVIGIGIGLWYGVPSTPLGEDSVPECCTLTLGDSVSINQIVEEAGYKPLWLGREKANVTVSVRDNDGKLSEVDNELMLSYNKDLKAFAATGIGEGTITFNSPVDKAVSFTVPFKVDYKAKETANIIKKEYAELLNDDIMTSDEIASVTSITVKDAEVDAADLAMFPALKTVNLNCDAGIPKMTNVKLGWEYFVPLDKYEDVLKTTEWAPYNKYIFPDVNKANDTCEVVFDTMGGEFTEASDLEDRPFNQGLYVLLVKSGSELDASDYNPVKKGYTFTKWMIYGNENANISPSDLPHTTEIKENLKVYAEWDEHKYTVKFNTNGGSGNVNTRTLKYSEEYRPDVSGIKREGYDFIGWSETANGSVRYNADDPIVSLTDKDSTEVTLYAVWRADVYNVEFYDGMELLDSKKNVGYFDTFKIIEYKAPSKIGMSFLGWSLNPAATTPDYSNGNEVSRLTDEYGATVKIYTVWDANRYTVKYDANGGTGAPEPQTVKYDEMGYVPDTKPTRYGYSFIGWGTSSTSTKVSYPAGSSYINLRSTNGATCTFYAVWNPDTFSIRFNNTGATSGSAETQIVNFGSPYTVKIDNFEKTGYYIAGWSTTQNSTSAQYDAGKLTEEQVAAFYQQATNLPNKCVDLYPVWKELSFKVSFDLKGGSMSGGQTYTMNYMQSLQLLAPTKPYYNFIGWYCKFDTVTYNAGQSIMGSKFKNLKNNDVVEFVAQWELAKYDISYNFNGGTGSASGATGVSIHDYVRLPDAPTRDGYTFAGWKCSADGNIYSPGTSAKNWADSTEKSVIFTAQWTKNS